MQEDKENMITPAIERHPLKIWAIWFYFWSILSLISVGIGGIAFAIAPYIGIGVWFAPLAGGTFFLVFGLMMIFTNLKQVEEGKWVVAQVFGAYADTWNPGAHWTFSIMGKDIITCQSISRGTITVDLEMDSSNNHPGGGDVDFLDLSSKVKASFVFRVTDPVAYLFGSADSKTAVTQAVITIINAFLSRFTIMNAIVLKDQITWRRTVQGLYKVDDKGESFVENEDLSEDLQTRPELKLIKDTWGVVIEKQNIQDIDLPPSFIEIRDELADMRYQVKIQEERNTLATKEQTEATTRAATDLTVKTKRGEGFASIVQALIAKGVSPDMAAEVAMKMITFDAVSQEGVSTILITDSSKAGEGAQTAAGMKAMGLQQTLVMPREEPAASAETAPPTQP